jgi:hypothetical protein
MTCSDGYPSVHRSLTEERDDLHRDGRYVLHSFPTEDNEDAFYVIHALFARGEYPTRETVR